MRAVRTLAAVVALMALAACADDADSTVEQPTASASAAPSEEPTASPEVEAQELPPLPEGWRWESYRDLVVGVPGDWGFTGGRISDWCASTGAGPLKPGVGRPGAVLDIGCPQPSPGEPDPGSLLANGGTYVAFTSAALANLKTEGDREVLRINDVALVIQAPEALRAQIAETVQQRNHVDHNGCPITHPISADPAWRPNAFDPAVLSAVTSMTACRYDFVSARNDPEHADTRLLVSSWQVTGAQAQSTAAAIAAAPAGGGPDDPSSCIQDAWYGDEAIVVRLDSAGGKPEYLVVRYSGCNYNGVDDGSVVHPLTVDDAQAFFHGSNAPNGFSGPTSKLEILRPDDADGGIG